MGEFDHWLKDKPKAKAAAGPDDEFGHWLKDKPAPAPPKLSPADAFKVADPARVAALEKKRDALGATAEKLKKEGVEQGLTDASGAQVIPDGIIGNATALAKDAWRAGGRAVDDVKRTVADPIKSAGAAALTAIETGVPGGLGMLLAGDPTDRMLNPPAVNDYARERAKEAADRANDAAASGTGTAKAVGGVIGSLSPLSVGGAAGRAGAGLVAKVIGKRTVGQLSSSPLVTNAAKGAIGSGFAASAEGAKGDVYMGKVPDVHRMGEDFVTAAGPAAAAGLGSIAAVGGATKKATSDMMADIAKSEKGHVAASKMQGIAKNDDDYFELIRKDNDLRGVPTMPAREALPIVKAKIAELSEPLTPAYDTLQAAKPGPGQKFAATADDWINRLRTRRAEIQEALGKGKGKGTAADRDNLDELIADLESRQVDPENSLHAVRKMHGELSAEAITAQGKLMGTPAAIKANAMKSELRDVMHAEMKERAKTSPEAAASYAAIEKGNKPIAMLARLEDALRFKDGKERAGIVKQTRLGMVAAGGGLGALGAAGVGQWDAALGMGIVAGAAQGVKALSAGGRAFNANLLAPLEIAIANGSKWADISKWAVPAGAAAGMTEAQTRGAYDKLQKVRTP